MFKLFVVLILLKVKWCPTDTYQQDPRINSEDGPFRERYPPVTGVRLPQLATGLLELDRVGPDRPNINEAQPGLWARNITQWLCRLCRKRNRLVCIRRYCAGSYFERNDIVPLLPPTAIDEDLY